ncbi:MAG: hypothetical protein E7661_04990 [Ruminococcaceae bacterium]|nr:hypothetical protein [Oscillospiraceae bacterium]
MKTKFSSPRVLGGFIKRGLPLILAVLQLTSMLASCDELGNNPGQGNHGTTNETAVGSVEGEHTEDKNESSNQHEQEVYPTIKNPELERYGLNGFFAGLQFEDVFVTMSSREYLERNFNDLLKKMEGPERVDSATDRYTFWLGKMAYDYYENVILDIYLDERQFNPQYKSILVITEDHDFALISEDLTSSDKFVTGFAKGEFRNDLGMCSDIGVEQINRMIDTIGYENVSDGVRQSFFGTLLMVGHDYSNRFRYGYIQLSGGISRDNDIPSIYYGNCSDMLFMGSEGILAELTPSYNESHNTIDELLEKEDDRHHERPQRPSVEETEVGNNE